MAIAAHRFSATTCHYLAATGARRVMVSPPMDLQRPHLGSGKGVVMGETDGGSDPNPPQPSP